MCNFHLHFMSPSHKSRGEGLLEVMKYETNNSHQILALTSIQRKECNAKTKEWKSLVLFSHQNQEASSVFSSVLSVRHHKLFNEYFAHAHAKRFFQKLPWQFIACRKVSRQAVLFL